MGKNLEPRIAKLECVMLPPKQFPIWLKVFGDRCGSKGQTIMKETNEEAIACHLAEHPEDAGREFDFIHIIIVHGKWNEEGKFICDDPDCAHFQKEGSAVCPI